MKNKLPVWVVGMIGLPAHSQNKLRKIMAAIFLTHAERPNRN